MSLKQRVRNLEKRFCVSKAPPSIIFVVVKAGPRDEFGRLIEPPKPYDSVKCRCGDKTYDRLPGETIEDFQHRVLSLQPKDGMPSLLVMLPRPDGE
jgi:hypothetical protein